MYFQPYGNGQQLNLNWIINEIIELHKQLDPEYETPSFSQIYPYSNLNQLNLDWILSELKTLKELAPEPTPELDIQAVAEALVALPFDSTKSYQIFDYISRDGEIWRATEAIPAGSAWDGSKWFKTKLGTDLSVLERWINAINASLTTLENTVDELSSADISDDSDAGGATVKASLNNLKGSLNTITPFDSTPTLNSTKGVTSGGVRNAIKITSNAAWKDAPLNQQTLYFYESGTAATTYDLPDNYCFVVVYKVLSTRGFAIAYKWDGGNTRVWTNKLHETWRGWVRINDYPTVHHITNVTMPTAAGAKTVTLPSVGITVPAGKYYFIQSFKILNNSNNAYYQFPVGGFNEYQPDAFIMDRGTMNGAYTIDIRLTASGVANYGGQPTIIDIVVM